MSSLLKTLLTGGICVSQTPALALPPLPSRLQFAFIGPGPQVVFTDSRPSIRIYRPWLITMGNNKSKRLHIMLPFLFLEIKQKVNYRSIRSKVFCKKGVLRYFTKFTGKHLCQSLFFNEVAGLSPATLLKKRL